MKSNTNIYTIIKFDDDYYVDNNIQSGGNKRNKIIKLNYLIL